MLKEFKEKLNKEGEVYLRVKARPGASETKARGILKDENGDTIKIDINAPATQGRANQELIKFLAKELEIFKNNVKIISGAGERVKLVKIKK